MSDVKKLTKPEQAKLDKRMKVIEEVTNGLGWVLESEVVAEGISLATRARRAVSDLRTRDNYFDPVVGQLYRSLNSVPANIVEGFARTTSDAALSFMLIARGSAYESLVHGRILGLEDWPHEEDVIRLCALVDKLIEQRVQIGGHDD